MCASARKSISCHGSWRRPASSPLASMYDGHCVRLMLNAHPPTNAATSPSPSPTTRPTTSPLPVPASHPSPNPNKSPTGRPPARISRSATCRSRLNAAHGLDTPDSSSGTPTSPSPSPNASPIAPNVAGEATSANPPTRTPSPIPKPSTSTNMSARTGNLSAKHVQVLWHCRAQARKPVRCWPGTRL